MRQQIDDRDDSLDIYLERITYISMIKGSCCDGRLEKMCID